MRFASRARVGTVLLLIFAAAVVRLWGVDPVVDDPIAAQAAPLIQQLGDDSYAQREAACRALEALGEKVLPALRKAAAKSDDAEIRIRAKSSVKSIILAASKSESTGLQTVLLDAGQFEMGSPVGELGQRPDEKLHRVSITQTFLLGAYEVTQDEYQQVMDTNPSWFAATGTSREKVAGIDTRRFPVENVTWFDALEFCNRLGKLDGYAPYYELKSPVRKEESITSAVVTVHGGNGYRLPTEAEWEYACRVNSKGRFHFGEAHSGTLANMKSVVAAGGYGGGGSRVVHLGRTAKVGSYPANHWGLYDMHGNAGEWCWDWYDKDFYSASPGDDPRGPEEGLHRVLRGGSWLVSDGSCRSASRFWMLPGESKEHWGFRVARTP